MCDEKFYVYIDVVDFSSTLCVLVLKTVVELGASAKGVFSFR